MGINLLNSGYPAGAPWNLYNLGGFGDWTIWMVHPRGQEKVVAVLEAYFDESGINPQDAHCVVAGFVGSSRQWQRFEQRWLKASEGVTFHGKDFFAQDGNGRRVKTYRGWSDDRATTYLDALWRVIEQSTLRPVGAVVEVSAPDKPFLWAFHEWLPRIAEPGWKVHVVFDQQQQYAPHVLKVFLDNKVCVTGLGKRLGELIFKDKTGVGGLQAADLLAHACYRRGRITRLSECFRAASISSFDTVTTRVAPAQRIGRVVPVIRQFVLKRGVV